MPNENLAAAGHMESLRKRVWTALVVTLPWGVLAARGYPFPYVDDLFYVGAGLNLAHGGGLVNPLLENFTHFYQYPPLYSFLIAGWEKVFGTSAATMVALFVVMAWTGTLCVVRGFQILNREFLGWMSAISFLIYLTCVGMRPDAFGLFFAALSFRSGVSQRRGVRYLSPLLAFLGMASLPSVLALMIPWLIYVTVTNRRMWIASLAGGAAVALVSCFMIKWQIAEFLRELSAANGVARNIQVSWVKVNWYRPMGLVKIVYPIAGAGVAMTIEGLRRKLRMADYLMFFSVLLGFYATVHSVSGHRIMGLITVIALGWYIDTLVPARRLKLTLTAVNSLLVIGSGLRPVLQGVTTQQTGNGPALLREVESIHPSRILVDEWSFRYVFNEQIWPGMVGVGFSNRPQGHLATLPVKYPDECWVLSAETVKNFKPQPGHGLPSPVHFTVGGKAVGDWLTNAGEVGVSPPGQ